MNCDKYDKAELKDSMSKITMCINPFGKGRLQEEDVCKIATLVNKIELLKEHGITSKSYTDKVKAYTGFVKTALNDYGISLNITYPFENPTSINNQIDVILRLAHLEEKQIKKFYDFTRIRDAKPKITSIQPTVDFLLSMRQISAETEDILQEEDEEKYYIDEEALKRQDDANRTGWLEAQKRKEKIAKIKSIQYIDPLS